MTAAPAQLAIVGNVAPLRVVRPSMAPAVRQYIVDEIRLAGGLECAFGCAWDARTKTITSAELLWRGSMNEVPSLASDHAAGRVALHNHPTGVLLPSAQDLANASALGAAGVGYAIVSNDGEHLYVVREPLEPYTWRDRAANPPTQSRILSVGKLWRFTLWYEAPTR